MSSKDNLGTLVKVKVPSLYFSFSISNPLLVSRWFSYRF